MEQEVNALELYLAMGVSFIASGFSSQPRVLANIVRQGMEHPGFAIVNVQSPCTTYNDTYELIKGNVKKGIAPSLWEIPSDHDASDKDAAKSIVAKGGLPIGILYKDTSRPSFDSALADLQTRVKPSSVEELLNSYAL
jgi:2-oxoglutarate ferredoxin oxidoreductase subunit beta